MRRTVATVGIALLMLAPSTLGSPANAAGVKRAISLAVTPSPAQAFSPVRVSGKVTKSPKGTKVTVRVRLGAGAWTTARIVKTANKKGNWSTTYTPTTSGVLSFRASVAKQKKGKTTLKPAMSPVRPVTVRALPRAFPAFSVTPAAVETGASVRVAGRVTNTPLGAPILIQTQRTGAAWATAATSKTTSTVGAFTASLSLPTAGAISVRAVVAASPGRAAATSKAATVTVSDESGPTGPQRTVRISLTSTGAQASGGKNNISSYGGQLSADGRYIVYTTRSMDVLVPGVEPPIAYDTLMFKDLSTGSLRFVALTPSGGLPDNPVSRVDMDAGGRYVAYSTYASDLVAGDTNENWDVFLWDSQTNATRRISQQADGTQVSGTSEDPDISSNGRYVSYTSGSSTLVPGDTNDTYDIFLWDRVTNTTSRVSVGTDGNQTDARSFESAVSGDGSTVAFTSQEPQIGDTPGAVSLYVWSAATGRSTLLLSGPVGSELTDISGMAISDDGRYITYQRLLPGAEGAAGNSVYEQWDRLTGQATLIGEATDWWGTSPKASTDGRYVAITTDASLTGADTNGEPDVYVWDRATGQRRLASVPNAGGQSNGISWPGGVTDSGDLVGYASSATNLVAGDTNSVEDIFVTDLTVP